MSRSTTGSLKAAIACLMACAVALTLPPESALAQAPPPEEVVPEDPSRDALARARALVEENNLDAALPLYEALLEARSKSGWLLLEVGSALTDAGRFGEALPYLERAMKADALNLEAALKTALCHDAIGQQASAIRLYKRILLVDPDHARARFNLGRLQYETGDLEQAEATYRDLVSRHPVHWMALNNLGLTLLDRGQPSAALSPLRRAHKLRSDDPGVMHNLGRVHAARRDFARALIWFERALKAWGADDLAAVRLHFDRGNALFGMGRYEGACVAYQAALRLDPTYAPAHLNLGAALANLGRHEESVQALEKAVDFNSERIAILHQIAQNHMAQEDPDAALVLLHRARRLDESNPRTYLLLSKALEARGDLEGARSALERACRLGASEACP